MSTEHDTALKSAVESLAAVQSFDANSIVRAEKLGSAFDFSSAKEPADRIVVLFNQVDASGLGYLPTANLLNLHSISESTRQLFQQALDFDPTSANATNTRDSIVASIASHEHTVFSNISPLISYLGSQLNGTQSVIDSLRLEIQNSKKTLDDLINSAQTASVEANSILETARIASANVGVSKEAGHFSKAADDHRNASEKWRTATFWSAGVLLAYSVGTAFLHKWEWMMPTSNLGLTQLLVSKVLVFGVLGYLLTLSAKNFLNHKHNEIVNKHRQNALLTYETMVNAGQTPEARNIVLQLAAASIYQLHETGYIKQGDSNSRGGIIEILPKTSVPLNVANSSN